MGGTPLLKFALPTPRSTWCKLCTSRVFILGTGIHYNGWGGGGGVEPFIEFCLTNSYMKPDLPGAIPASSETQESTNTEIPPGKAIL